MSTDPSPSSLSPQSPPLSSQVIRDVEWREVFPWLHIFRSFRIACQPAKLTFAWVLLLGTYLGGRILDFGWYHFGWAHEHGVFLPFFMFETEQVKHLSAAVLGVSFGEVFYCIGNFLVVGPSAFFYEHPIYAAIFSFWFLLLWAIFGGAVSRLAAVDVTRDERISVRQAIRFSSGKMLSFIFAPLIPLMIFFLLAAVLAAAGLILLHIPFAGPILLGVFFFLPLLLAAVMALVFLGAAGGINLMYPTISVEGSDSFDAISRSFSYVFARPWRLVFFTLIAVVYGALCYLFVRFFLFLLFSLAHYFLAWWLAKSGQPAHYWPVLWPELSFDQLSYPIDYSLLKPTDRIAAVLIAFWSYLFLSLLGAFVISFYFTANTVIYALLRRDVDATELDDVYLEEVEEEFTEAPPPLSSAPDKLPAAEPPPTAE